MILSAWSNRHLLAQPPGCRRACRLFHCTGTRGFGQRRPGHQQEGSGL